MADLKISQLTELASATVSSSDWIPIVDTSDTSMAATGTTKKLAAKVALTDVANTFSAANTFSNSVTAEVLRALDGDGLNLQNDAGQTALQIEDDGDIIAGISGSYAQRFYVSNIAFRSIFEMTATQIRLLSVFTPITNGIFLVYNLSGVRCALFHIRGAGNEVIEVGGLDTANVFTTTKDNASTINVYWDAANSQYRVQNNTGSTIFLAILAIGQ